MLENPDIPAQLLIDHAGTVYGLTITAVEFLPWGADFNSAVYRLSAGDRGSYLLKLRKGGFVETAVTIPAHLASQGMRQIIAPMATTAGRFWGQMGSYTTILYPFVAGQDGYEVTLSAAHFRELGQALRKIQSTQFPPEILAQVRRESYNPLARDTVSHYLTTLTEPFADPIAQELAHYLQEKKTAVRELIRRAESLAQRLQEDPPPFIVCHADLHAGNIYIAEDGRLYLIDWDEVILAPKERDLMFIGAALLASGRSPAEEEALFYPAYGPVDLDETALAYYRCERIIQDIYEYCRQIFSQDGSTADRQEGLYYLKSNFLPGSTIEAAYRSD